MPWLHASSLCVRTCKGNDKKPVDKPRKQKRQRAQQRGIKRLNMIDMANIETRMQAKRETKQDTKQTRAVSMKDKCRFGLDVHSFIVLKNG